MLIVAMLDLYNPHFLTHQTIGVGAGGTERWHLTGKAKLNWKYKSPKNGHLKILPPACTKIYFVMI